MTRHAELLDSAVAGEHFRIFHDAERVIADPVVRNRGTVGGSLGQADPSEDLSAVFAALRATSSIQGTGGTRTVPAREFHLGPYETVGRRRRDDHRDPRPDPARCRQRLPARSSGGPATGPSPPPARRLARWRHRHRGRHRADGRRRRALLRPRRRGLAARRRRHRRAHRRGGALAAEHCNPTTDQRGPADYKRHLAGELTKRALRPAIARARGEEHDDEHQHHVNGETRSADVEPRVLLVHLLRDDFGLTGTHWGCDTSNCGACVVLLDGVPVKSCTVLGVMADGRRVDTVEGLEGPTASIPCSKGSWSATACSAASAPRR